MSNLFKIDFVQGKTDAADYGQVKHSMVDTASDRIIISLSVSADKLQSVSNYSREPKRLVFECFPTTWIQNNILSGNNEHERYISHFEVKVYRDTVLFFTGIIDTSQLSFDVSTGILKFTCYDKIKLLSVFSDLTHYYGLTAGYLPIWILGYFLQDIEQAIPISIPYSNQFVHPILSISSDARLILAHIDIDDMYDYPDPPGWWEYSHNSESYTGFIFDSVSNKSTFVFAHKVVITGTSSDPPSTQYQGRFRGRIYRFYNGICPVFEEYDDTTDWVGGLSSIDSAYNDLLEFFAVNGISLSNLSPNGTIGGINYGFTHTAGNFVEANCYGNVFPERLKPGKAYETFTAEQTDNLKALKAMLMLYNATIFTDTLGRIVLKNKDAFSASVIDIEENDVVSLIIKRGNHELPDTTTIDVLAGDTTQLQGIIKDYLLEFYGGRWALQASIDQLTKYDLSLFSKIRIRDHIYTINEIEKDYINDEYNIKGFQL
ncbi:MAG: hypothetical protein PHY48_16555 [Candidatus Cloacimonetes bacterium]|nr:hypothetical protein [Candidatus Cloacimonadota bacterium]